MRAAHPRGKPGQVSDEGGYWQDAAHCYSHCQSIPHAVRLLAAHNSCPVGAVGGDWH